MRSRLALLLALIIGMTSALAESVQLQSLERLRGGPEQPAGRKAGYIHLTFPGALAAKSGEIYIADTGLGRVLQYDRATGRYTLLMPAHGGTQIALGSDRSLYILDPACRCIQRYDRLGRLMQQYADHRNLLAPRDFALDEVRGLVWAMDGAYSQLMSFNPFGRIMQVIRLVDAGFPPGVPVALARGMEGFLIIDRVGRRVVVVDEMGRLVRLLGQGKLQDPVSVVQDPHGRVLVADRSIGIWRVWPEPVEMVSNVRFRHIGDMTVDEFNVIVSDQTGRFVEIMHYPPPPAR